MPRVSSAPEDAMHFKGSWQDGWGKVIACQTLVFQFPPMKEAKFGRPAGYQGPPSLMAELTIQRYLDGDGNISPYQPEQVLLGIQNSSKDTGMLDLFHPGNYPGDPPDVNAEPEDCGGDLGAVGNTVYSMKDGLQFMENCKWMRFTASLGEKGFKKEILKRTYFPDMVGLYAFFTNVTGKKWSADMDSDPTWLAVKEVKEWPYEQKSGAKAGAKGKATTPAAAKPAAAARPAASAPAAPPPAAAEPSTDGTNGAAELTAEEWATAILTDTVIPNRKGKILDSVEKLKIDVFMSISKHKPSVPATLKKEIQAQLGNIEWLMAVGEATGAFEQQADGKIAFAN